jgi:peptidyl-prolyl cis-trans isomerase D
MLKILRKQFRTIMWILAFIIVPSFIWWGSGSLSRTRKERGSTFAGQVFGKKVSFQEYINAYVAARNQYRLMYLDRYPEVEKNLDLNRETWDRLILLRQAKSRGITSNNKEVLEYIKSIPIFQKDDKFDKQAYSRVLAYLGIEPAEFESGVRESVMLSKLREKVTENVKKMSPDEVEQEYVKANEKVKGRYLLVEPAAFKQAVSVSDAEINDYYNNHKQELTTQEEANVEYLAINYQDMEKEVTLPDERIKQYYDSHMEEFRLPEQNEQSSSDSPQPAEHSPAESPLAGAVEKKPGYKPFEEVKEDIKSNLVREEAQKKAKDIAIKIADELFENEESGSPKFQETAAKNSLSVRETGFFSREASIPDIGFAPQLANVVFKLQGGEVSDIIKGPKAYYVIRLKEKRQPHIPGLTEVSDKVRNILTNEKAQEMAKSKAEEYHARIVAARTSGQTDFSEICKTLGQEPRETEPFTRRGYIPGIGMSEELGNEAFALNNGDISPVVNTPRGYVIFQAVEHQSVSKEELAKDRDEFAVWLEQRRKSEYFFEWFKKVKEDAKLADNISKRTEGAP